MMKKGSGLGAAAVMIVALCAGCGDDSGGGGPGGPGSGNGVGQVSFTVTGDVQGSKSGDAYILTVEAGSMHSLTLSMHDFGPQTFSLTFTLVSPNPIDPPAPGDHEVGGVGNFGAAYSHIEDGDHANSVEYTDALCPEELDQGGTLTFDSATLSQMTGSFDLVLGSFDIGAEGCELLGSIALSGTFDARASQ